jgi:hypothetical protein
MSGSLEAGRALLEEAAHALMVVFGLPQGARGVAHPGPEFVQVADSVPDAVADQVELHPNLLSRAA